jgi:hypothetical protein
VGASVISDWFIVDRAVGVDDAHRYRHC